MTAGGGLGGGRGGGGQPINGINDLKFSFLVLNGILQGSVAPYFPFVRVLAGDDSDHSLVKADFGLGKL